MGIKETNFTENTFTKISQDLDGLNKIIAEIVPKTMVKTASTFGNSAHIVLPKDFINKKIGVIILSKETIMKGGEL